MSAQPCGKLCRREEVDVYIEQLEARVAAADKLAAALIGYLTNNGTPLERHRIGLHAMIAYGATKEQSE